MFDAQHIWKPAKFSKESCAVTSSSGLKIITGALTEEDSGARVENTARQVCCFGKREVFRGSI